MLKNVVVFYKNKKISKKCLTKGEESGRIIKRSHEEGEGLKEKSLKKLKKLSKKVLTIKLDCDIITKSPRESATNGH